MISVEKIKKAESILIDNGMDVDDAKEVLRAVGYVLLDEELYSQNNRWVVVTYTTTEDGEKENVIVLLPGYKAVQHGWLDKSGNSIPERANCSRSNNKIYIFDNQASAEEFARCLKESLVYAEEEKTTLIK